MSETASPAALLIGAIRDASKSARLMTLEDMALIRLKNPDKSEGLQAVASGPGKLGVLHKNASGVNQIQVGNDEMEAGQESSLDPEKIEALLTEQAEDDIKLMRGSRDVYYFSDRFMTAAYALHLFRVAEKDPARMIADTVRDESRIYPRPTPVSTFLATPFRLTTAELDGLLWQISQRNDMTDIKSTAASDGSIYLYSSDFLEDTHADSLAEWDAVGQAENP